MTFDATAAFNIDQDTVEEVGPQGGPQYPILMHLSGDVKLANKGLTGAESEGGLFFATTPREDANQEERERMERVAAVLAEAGWQEDSWTPYNGAPVAGLWKATVAASVITIRECWEVKIENEKQTRTVRAPWGWDHFNALKEQHQGKTPHSRVHVMLMLKGLETLGPLVLTLKGYAGMYFKGHKKCEFIGVLHHFQRVVLNKANEQTAEAAKKAGKTAARWPARCFWLPFGASKDAKGKPLFITAGSGQQSSQIVVPQAHLPHDAAEVDLSKLYVGRELQNTFQELYQSDEVTKWREEWKTLDPNAQDSDNHEHEDGATPAAKPPQAPVDADLESLGL
ncbi:hypothetical protein GC175_17170 [bacterium]|nr:hypothetical protein [bacterium]